MLGVHEGPLHVLYGPLTRPYSSCPYGFPGRRALCKRREIGSPHHFEEIKG